MEHFSDAMPQLQSSVSTEVANMCATSREKARDALNRTNCSVELAVDFLLTTTCPYRHELMELGGLSEGDAEEYFHRANGDLEAAKLLILQEHMHIPVETVDVVNRPTSQFECPICLSTCVPSESICLSDCGHFFCEDCLKGRIRAEESESSTGRVRCPMAPSACSSFLTQQEITHLSGVATFRKLDRRALEHTALCDDTMYPCPSANCTGIVFWHVNMDISPHSTCQLCGLDRCVACGVSPYHDGMNCAEYAQASRASIPGSGGNGVSGTASIASVGASAGCEDEQRLTIEEQEARTMAYLKSVGTRQCPKCKAGVQKSAGCNKMQCRCDYRFCFECLIEDATCDCTPREHGFIDNRTGRGDFSNLRYLPPSRRSNQPRAWLVGEAPDADGSTGGGSTARTRSLSLGIFSARWKLKPSAENKHGGNDNGTG